MTLRACIVGFVVVVGCGGSDATFTGVGPSGVTVGAPCTANNQCANKCIRATCSITCNSDLDCPAGSVCINSDGGMCAYPCTTNAECATGQICEGEERKGAAGKALTCRRP